MPHDLSEIQKNWDDLGRRDPLGVIKTGISKEGGVWESKEGGKWNPRDFFQTGIEEIDSLMKQIDELGLKPPHKNALDFGCGVGRATQALSKYFETVDGVDIAPSMIESANTYNKEKKRIHFFVNDQDSLAMFKDNSYDFIYSIEVFQHMHPRYQEKYLKELLRILSPDGMLVFELPSEYESLKRKIFFNFIFQDVKFIHSLYWKTMKKRPSFALMQFYCNPRKNVESFLLNHGAKHVNPIRNSRTIVSYHYFVTKY